MCKVVKLEDYKKQKEDKIWKEFEKNFDKEIVQAYRDFYEDGGFENYEQYNRI